MTKLRKEVYDNEILCSLLGTFKKGDAMNAVKSSRTLYLSGEVEYEKIGELIEDVLKLAEQDPLAWINLYVISPGGINQPGMGLIDVIETQKIHLQTLAVGEIGSMAIPIFMAGEHRVAMKRSCFTFHEICRVIERGSTRLTPSKIRKIAVDIEQCQKDYMHAIISRDPLVDEKKILQLMLDETKLFAEEALELGIVHEII